MISGLITGAVVASRTHKMMELQGVDDVPEMDQ